MMMDGEAKTLADRLESLYERRTFGIKPGLAVEESILNALGNPERSFLPVHVAGTNGKGSVCAMLESIFRHAGMRTGLYTSPHLVRFNERMRVNGTPIQDQELLDLWLIGEMAEKQAATGQEWSKATFFEFTTALAFEFFRRHDIQVGVVEVGLGGRLDATNVVMPLVSAIAPISLEHREFLGDTIDSIASEKAGIVKPGRPVVYAQAHADAEEVITRKAKEFGCRCVNALDVVRVERVSQNLDGQKMRVESESQSYGAIRMSLLGRHQLENVALAVAAAEEAYAAMQLPLPPSAVKEGLEGVCWLGRLQVLEREPVTILDGGHNPGAALALAESLKELTDKKPVGLICGMCGDKDVESFFRPLARRLKKVWIVPLQTPRSMPPESLLAAVKKFELQAELMSLSEAREEARKWALESGGAVCIAGSLFLVGEVLEKEWR